MMNDWSITNYVDSSLTGTWVYYANRNFPNIHFSRCVDDSNRDHMATDDRAYYYFGVTRTFNTQAVPQATQQTLTGAWTDYFTVRAPAANKPASSPSQTTRSKTSKRPRK